MMTSVVDAPGPRPHRLAKLRPSRNLMTSPTNQQRPALLNGVRLPLSCGAVSTQRSFTFQPVVLGGARMPALAAKRCMLSLSLSPPPPPPPTQLSEARAAQGRTACAWAGGFDHQDGNLSTGATPAFA